MRLTSAQARPASPARRKGATLVEAALVLTVFLLFLFGLFEYCRYIFILHVSTNAAREGARYAVVKASDPTVTYGPGAPPLPNEPAADPSRPTYSVPLIQQYVIDRMGGTNGMIANFTVRVYTADTAQLYATPCVVTPKQNTTTWAAAGFTEKIGVQIAGSYRPILPTFLFMDPDMRVNTVSLMGSEG